MIGLETVRIIPHRGLSQTRPRIRPRRGRDGRGQPRDQPRARHHRIVQKLKLMKIVL